MSELTPATEVLFVDPGENAWTTVEYELHTGSDTIWRRFAGQRWTLEISASRPRSGRLTTPDLTAGQIVQYATFGRNDDPNIISSPMGLMEIRPPRPRSLVTISVLLKDPDPAYLIDLSSPPTRYRAPLFPTSQFLPGGTYHASLVVTYKPTNIIAKIGRAAPQINDIPGFLDIAEADVVAESFNLSMHGVVAMPLLPGTQYHYLVRASDAAGNWQVHTFPFVTLRRTTTIEFDQIDIHNDSDHFGWDDTGEATFWFKIFRGNTMEKEFSHGRIEISDDEAARSKKHIPLNFSHTIGPESLNGKNTGISVSVEGKEYDTLTVLFDVIETEDHAEYRMPDRPYIKAMPILFPAGPNEEVTNRWESMSASATDGSSLHFNVNWKWSVSYQ